MVKDSQRGTFLVIENDSAKAISDGSKNLSLSPSYSSPSSPSYIHCNSKSDFIPPHSSPSTTLSTQVDDHDKENGTGNSISKLIKYPINYNNQQSLSSFTDAKEVNKSLNLHLGLQFNPRKVKLIRLVCHTISFFLALVEKYLFKGWDSIPLSLRQSVAMKAWKIYFPIHKKLLNNKTGIHPNASYEYHAMTTILYWGRLFPVSLRRMRFSLSQLACCHGAEAYPVTLDNVSCLGYDTSTISSSSSLDINTSRKQQRKRKQICGLKSIHVHTVNYNMVSNHKDKCQYLCKPYMRKNAPFATNAVINDIKEDPTNVTGYFIQHNSKPSSKVILWMYGGAYLSGDSKGNLNFAEKTGQQASFMDVFVPDYRLLPEYTFFDALYDTCLAYEYLVCVQGYHPKDIVLYGISSGGGLLVRLMQRIVEFQEEQQSLKDGSDNIDDVNDGVKKWIEKLQIVPRGAVLLGPFVDYTEPKGSFVEYRMHDLIVNESVCEDNLQYLDTLGSQEKNREESPVYRSMKGLPPICIIVSEHECVYDQNILFCNNARRDGVEVDLVVWKYMCHVWAVWSAFLPEAKQAVDFMCDWVKTICVDD